MVIFKTVSLFIWCHDISVCNCIFEFVFLLSCSETQPEKIKCLCMLINMFISI